MNHRTVHNFSVFFVLYLMETLEHYKAILYPLLTILFPCLTVHTYALAVFFHVKLFATIGHDWIQFHMPPTILYSHRYFVNVSSRVPSSGYIL